MATTQFSGDPNSVFVSNWPLDLIIDFEYPPEGVPVRQLKKGLLEAKRFSGGMKKVKKSEIVALAKTQLNTRLATPLSASVLAIKDVLPEHMDLTNQDFIQGLHELIRAIDSNHKGVITRSDIKEFAKNPPSELKERLANIMGAH